MKSETEDKLLAMLDYVGDLLKDGVDLAKKEVPVIVKEILSYKLLEAIISSIASLMVLIGSIVGFLYAYPLASSDSVGAVFAVIGALIAGLISLISLSCNLSEIIKIKFAPRVYMIEYISYLKKQ